MTRIASHLVAQNELPTADRVEELFLIRRAEQERARQRAEAVVTDPRDVLTAIDAHWNTHGHGPPWRELARDLGIDTDALEALLWQLARRKLVHFTRAPGSLRTIGTPPPAASGGPAPEGR